jgi:signal transduction histidine kinase
MALGTVAPGAHVAPDLLALRLAMLQLRATLERLGVGDGPEDFAQILVDIEGRIQHATPRAHEILAHADDLVGVPIATVARWLTAAEGRSLEPGALHSTRVRRADGATHFVNHRATTLYGPEGQPIGMLFTLHDTTNSVARDELAEKSRQLDEARERLTRAQHLKALGQLSAEVAHEFGNLLQAIGLQAAALRRSGGLPEPVIRSIWSIKQAVDIGQALTRRLLTFARNDPEERMERIDVCRVLRDLVQLLEPRINQRGRSVRMELSLPELPEISGNETKLTEVFLNLFLNAMDAMPDGGALTITASDRSGEIRIAVRDTGKGMSPDELARAFDPFFTTKPGGTGLGLSTVYGVVRAHGGSVFVESEPGRGTTVFVSLPTATPPEVAFPSQRPGAARDLGRVLVVDDHPTIREATCELLVSQGYEVESAGTVAEALAALDRGRFAVVITDVGLPDRPGWEVARAAKAGSAATAVLLVTGWGSHFSADEAKTRGADLVFEKPVDPDVLLSAIASFG